MFQVSIGLNGNLGAVSFSGDIFVFGSNTEGFSCNYKFSERGEFIADLSKDPLIPDSMKSRAHVVQDGRIYAAAFKLLNTEWKWRLEAFDGSKWSLV